MLAATNRQRMLLVAREPRSAGTKRSKVRPAHSATGATSSGLAAAKEVHGSS